MPELVLGASTGFAAKRWPEADEWTRIAHEVGLDAVQFSFDLLDPGLVRTVDVFARVRDVCEGRGIRIASALTGASPYAQNWLSHPDAAMRRGAEGWYQRAIAAAATLGARSVGGHIGALSARQNRTARARAAAITRTTNAVLRLAEHAARAGLECLTWKVMPVAREYPARMDEVEELMVSLDARAAVPVRLCLDVGHICLADGGPEERDPYRWLERLGPYAAVVHLQQTDGVADRHWPFTDTYNSRGVIDAERVVAIARTLPQPRLELMLAPVHPSEVPDEEVVRDLAASVAHWRPAVAPTDTNEMVLQTTRRSA